MRRCLLVSCGSGNAAPHGMEHSSEKKNKREIWKEAKDYRDGPKVLYLSYLSLACREKNPKQSQIWVFQLPFKKALLRGCLQKAGLPIGRARRIAPCLTQKCLFLLISYLGARGIAPQASDARETHLIPGEGGEYSVRAKYF